jgi:hypothetical protein
MLPTGIEVCPYLLRLQNGDVSLSVLYELPGYAQAFRIED